MAAVLSFSKERKLKETLELITTNYLLLLNTLNHPFQTQQNTSNISNSLTHFSEEKKKLLSWLLLVSFFFQRLTFKIFMTPFYYEQIVINNSFVPQHNKGLLRVRLGGSGWRVGIYELERGLCIYLFVKYIKQFIYIHSFFVSFFTRFATG